MASIFANERSVVMVNSIETTIPSKEQNIEMMTKYPDLEDKNDLKDESFPFSKQDN